MLRSLLLILFTISINSNAQDIIYRLVLKDQCKNNFEYSLLHQLIQKDSMYLIQDTLGTIYLNRTGNYTLDASLYHISKELKIEKGVNTDTLNLPIIYKCIEPLSHPNFVGYCCCGEKCDGYKEDYYYNGQLRISGKFKSGYAIEKVVEFYQNGQVKEIRIYDKKGKGILKSKISYDKDGNAVQ